MPRKEKPSACAETSTSDGVRNSALLFPFFLILYLYIFCFIVVIE